MKTNIITQVFKDNQKLKNIPLNIGLNKLYLYTYQIDTSSNSLYNISVVIILCIILIIYEILTK